MDELARLLVLLALAGVALTVVGTLAARLSTEDRKLRRSLKKVLKGDPHAMLVAPGRGRAVGFNFTSERMAVSWEAGAWCLVYKVEEMVGAELIVDGQVIARAHRGEPRRALDTLTGADEHVRLRLIFDDPRHPDFDLVLWEAADEGRRGALAAPDAVQEANRWLARVEAVVRKPARFRSDPQPPPVAQAHEAPKPEPAAATAGRADAPPPPVAAQDDLFDLPPWDDDPDEALVDSVNR